MSGCWDFARIRQKTTGGEGMAWSVPIPWPPTPIMTCQIDLFCTAQLTDAETYAAAPIGGYRTVAADQPQSLSVMEMLGRRLPYRRILALRRQLNLGQLPETLAPTNDNLKTGHFIPCAKP
jgi:hypothetical protein